jgi:hypothetical protein
MYSLQQAAAMTLQLGLTRRMYSGIRTLNFGLTLPAHKDMNEVMHSTSPELNEVRTPNGMSMCHVPLATQLVADIQHDPRFRQTQQHHIKIGGDSATDLKEKAVNARSVLILAYAWCGESGAGANSIDSHRLTSAAWAHETSANVRDMMQLTSTEIMKLEDEGLMVEVDGTVQHHKFTFSLHGDYKWIRMVYGLGSPASTYCCIYCDVEKSHIYDSMKKDNKDCPLDKMLSLKTMHERAFVADDERRKKDKSTTESKEEKIEQWTAEGCVTEPMKKKTVTVGVVTYNQEYAPATCIPPKHCPPEPLSYAVTNS